MVSKDLNPFLQLLRYLARWAKITGTGRYKEPEAIKIFSRIQDKYYPFSREEEVWQFIPSVGTPKTNFNGKYLYLLAVEGPPLFVPALSLSCDFARPIPEVRLRVGLFRTDGDEIRCIGLRFETPEGEGQHNYYHAQFVRELSGRAGTGHYMDWLPERNPAVPLDARDPVTLLLTLVVSLYGLDQAGRWTSDLRVLEEYWKAMRCRSFSPKYWLVCVSKQRHKYKTDLSDDRFKTRARAKHGRKAEIQASDRTTYEANDGCQRQEM